MKYNLCLLSMVPAARYLLPKKCFCPLCKKNSVFFLPSPNKPSELLAELGGVGGNPKALQCAWCGSTDRERHLWMYINAANMKKSFADADILHFAPEKRLYRQLQSCRPQSYLMADLYPNNAQVLSEDICDMSFSENAFDIIIANHVLEHVDDDMAALKEIGRVLRPGGYAILQTPYCVDLYMTWSDEGVCSDRAREIAYGQRDHVRLYGKDIFERFASSGLVPMTKKHDQLLSDLPAERYGVNEKEPFFLFTVPS